MPANPWARQNNDLICSRARRSIGSSRDIQASTQPVGEVSTRPPPPTTSRSARSRVHHRQECSSWWLRARRHGLTYQVPREHFHPRPWLEPQNAPSAPSTADHPTEIKPYSSRGPTLDTRPPDLVSSRLATTTTDNRSAHERVRAVGAARPTSSSQPLTPPTHRVGFAHRRRAPQHPNSTFGAGRLGPRSTPFGPAAALAWPGRRRRHRGQALLRSRPTAVDGAGLVVGPASRPERDMRRVRCHQTQNFRRSYSCANGLTHAAVAGVGDSQQVHSLLFQAAAPHRTTRLTPTFQRARGSGPCRCV